MKELLQNILLENKSLKVVHRNIAKKKNTLRIIARNKISTKVKNQMKSKLEPDKENIKVRYILKLKIIDVMDLTYLHKFLNLKQV